MEKINFIIGIILISLLAVWAAWSMINYRQIKRMLCIGKRRTLINDYIQTIAGLIVFATLAIIACGTSIFTVPDSYFLGNSAAIYKIIIYVAVAVIVAYQIISSYILSKHNDKIPKNISYFLPLTFNEKLIFVFVCLFAGFCEELVFRGFALIFMAQFGINIWLAFAVSALAFGLMHLYQGISGLIISFFTGILLAGLFAVSGNILLPIIIHIVIDICAVIIRNQDTPQVNG
ncbi:MAG: CPBP family intramembrane metalloprotease [Prevotellaceae bacterium]|jgi:membrane protease YdiL (CAAX protease family)|nr:CPBP family intramembrane metalloprotease [Prevotellaceae bacterium]